MCLLRIIVRVSRVVKPSQYCRRFPSGLLFLFRVGIEVDLVRKVSDNIVYRGTLSDISLNYFARYFDVSLTRLAVRSNSCSSHCHFSPRAEAMMLGALRGAAAGWLFTDTGRKGALLLCQHPLIVQDNCD